MYSLALQLPPYLAKSFRFGVLFETKRREVHPGAEHASFGQNTDATNAVKIHLHIRVAVWITEVSKVGPPRRVLSVSFHDNGVLVESVRKRQRSLGFLP